MLGGREQVSKAPCGNECRTERLLGPALSLTRTLLTPSLQKFHTTTGYLETQERSCCSGEAVPAAPWHHKGEQKEKGFD